MARATLIQLLLVALLVLVEAQMLHNKPIHTISVNGKYYDVAVKRNTEITFLAVVTDAGADLTNHSIEVKHPNGTMSYNGWLNDNAWQPGVEGNGSQSIKTARVTVSDEGAYLFRARATHDEDPAQYWSNTLRVIIYANDTLQSDYVPDTVLYPDGTVNRTAYELYWASWSPSAQSKRFGSSFEDLNPSPQEDRPTNPQTGTFTCPTSYLNQYSPYELGRQGCRADSDSWSTAGQVGYIPVLPGDPGIDRIQTFAYYSNVFAISPRFDQASGNPHPDPTTRLTEYAGAAQYPIATVRNYAQQQNEALTIYRTGLLGVNSLQTSRAASDRSFPGLRFPAHLVPTDLAVTSGNELAVVTLWDTRTLTGKLAVVAIEAKFLPLYTTPYLGMPNQGSFSDLVLLGYVDLPIAAPTSVSAASNHRWHGPRETDGLSLGQLDFTSSSVRQSLYDGEWNAVVATKGYAIIASKFEDKVCIVDLTPILLEFREAWLMNYDTTLSARSEGRWPATFDSTVGPPSSPGNTPTDSLASDGTRLGWSDLWTGIKAVASLWSSADERGADKRRDEIYHRRRRAVLPSPRVVATFDMEQPVAVLAGKELQRESTDRFKAHVALANGDVVIIDASSLMARFDYQTSAELKVMGSFRVCEGPTAIVPARFARQDLPLLPKDGSVNQTIASDPLNNHFYVICRGSREISGVITYAGEGAVWKRFKDVRLDDPVNAAVADRGNVLTVTDFKGRKIVNFLIGSIADPNGRQYLAPAEGFRYAGELPLDGYPFTISVANVH